MPDHADEFGFVAFALERHIAARAEMAGLSWDTHDAAFLLGVITEWLTANDAVLTGDGVAHNTINWRHVADVLAEELARWGWGDFHYGAQPQEESVVTALGVYREAVERDA